MILFIVLGAVVLITLLVLGVLFFLLSKEGQKKEELAVPVTDLDELKKELSSEILGIQDPPIELKITLPIPAIQSVVNASPVQPDETKNLIESLTKENESLKSQQDNYQETQQKLTELQGEASNLKIDNLRLQTQLESSHAKVRLLEEAMADLKIQMGDEISRANGLIAEMKQEKEASLSVPKPDEGPAVRLELEEAHQKLSELNAQLTQKNDLLQYELIKARAQSSGLERVSFNYKNQLEDFFKKINAVQVTNDHLTQAKNRLEGLVEEVKLQNEDLVKKDQLTQFELEKNRSRLVNLERECEDLKVRVQQQGQQ